MRFRAQFATAALSMALVGGLTAAATTTAQARPTDSAATSAAAAKYYLKFDKSTVTNSRLYLMQSVSGPDKVIRKYKAGSGVNTNTCARNKGWLPNGDYKIEFHRKNFDGVINGYVIKISDKKCHNGTKRDALFIHSEMKPNGRQGSIESEKWTNSNPNDYYSNGCIKLNPTNIKNLFAKVDSLGWSKLAKLKVVS
ncbi:ErfK/YbiS/YcfS/YnhG superfamily protein [Streptomyces himastatinicus ATCC 53653]|uniref:ErfK/YbiS/YcfS/YnhG superfamily protein n=1 Tax=Streptomyces himastatinicus ATCC 53653 TaxID=457427 RepID=D9WC34_9ACTN|nr:L,D-transpeptidase [Streptomyces himastatinicus]EFL27082.1 ErfK/YbiS/YcfS/YnhG superfamily protein [Streptomyces himastatinicus ATCC 53653]